MRHWRWTGLAVVLVLLVSGPPPARGQAPAPGGRAVFGLIAGWDHLDPHRWTGFFFAQLIMANIYDPLLVRDPKTAVLRPGLAESFDLAGRQDPMKEPFAPILDALSLPMTAPVSMAAVRQYGDNFGQNPVGTGPFMFKDLVPGDRLVLVRNPDYRWAPSIFPHRGPAFLEERVYRIVPEDLTRLALLERNEMSFINYPVPREIARLKGDRRYRVVEVGRPGVPRMVTMNSPGGGGLRREVAPALPHGLSPTVNAPC